MASGSSGFLYVDDFAVITTVICADIFQKDEK